MLKHKQLLIFGGLLTSLLFAGCVSKNSNPNTSIFAPLENSPSNSAATITPSVALTDAPPAVWINPILPEDFKSQLILDPEWVEVQQPADADIFFTIGNESTISTWVYSLAAPFATITDDLPANVLLQVWMGQNDPNSPLQTLLVDSQTAAIFQEMWGAPSAQTVSVVAAEQLSDLCWQTPNTWAIIPFERIDHTWKIISIDGQSPIRKDFDPDAYILNVPISFISNNNEMDTALITEINAPLSNRDPSKLTTVVLTGVTALVRATAQMMEYEGMTYPAQDIGPWLREADILHINNEIPFAANCPPPFPREDNLVFCSKEKYIQLLEDIGTDVVELSGDHFQDWGPEADYFTIDLYRQRGWQYYGGGENLADGQKPLLIEHNGNRIAFLGCNAKGRGYASASETQPGAVFCNFDVITQQIKDLRSQGYLPIVTFQHLEYYDYKINPYLQTDFQKVAEAGAVIVSGSQAHQPHAFELYEDSFLHYGLGNLFFDQIKEGIPTQQAFIDRHVFYAGKYINTELLTIRFVDYARSRPMTPEERAELLDTVFSLSIWKQP